MLGNGQYEPGYKRTYWEGCTHGFTVRGDLVSAVLLATAALLIHMYVRAILW